LVGAHAGRSRRTCELKCDNACFHAEDRNDAAARTFSWRLFLVCGNPEDPTTYFAGFDPAQVSPVACPDNLAFDPNGNLWISTDGQQGTIGKADAFHAGGFRGLRAGVHAGRTGTVLCRAAPRGPRHRPRGVARRQLPAQAVGRHDLPHEG
jgi:hypothetical protein